jgi:hypothetical protein
MTGKLYYLTTLGAWREHAARFATSHFIVLDVPPASVNPVGARSRDYIREARDAHTAPGEDGSADAARSPLAPSPTDERAPDDAARILVLVEADEGAHLALEGDARFEALPHPLVQKPISHAARAAFSAHDIPYGATTFDVAEAVSRAHPLLRHRVF